MNLTVHLIPVPNSLMFCYPYILPSDTMLPATSNFESTPQSLISEISLISSLKSDLRDFKSLLPHQIVTALVYPTIV